MNWWIYLLTAVIPLAVGAVYYHPKVVGAAWMKTNNFTTADLEGGNMAVTFGLAYLASIFVAFSLLPLTVHQMSVVSILMEVEGYGADGSDVMNTLANFKENYWNEGRNFGHGSFHGILYTVFLIIPVLGINALFERRSFKYLLVHAGYWLITLALMGGVIGQFALLPAE